MAEKNKQSPEQWRELAAKELRGKPLDELTWQTPEGIAVKPLYSSEDLEGLDQKEGAERMNISRPTFQRVLASGRQKIADVLLNGKAIRIEGGSFEMAFSRFKCLNGHEWDVPFEVMTNKPPQLCPKCNTSSIEPLLLTGSGWGGRGWGRHQGRQKIRKR